MAQLTHKRTRYEAGGQAGKVASLYPDGVFEGDVLPEYGGELLFGGVGLLE